MILKILDDIIKSLFRGDKCVIKRLKKELSDKEKRNHYIKYLVVGIITTVISIVGFKLIRIYIPTLNENIANILSIIFAIICSYFMNRSWVFESKEKNMFKEFGKFFSGRLVTLVVEELVFLIGTSALNFDELIVKISSSAIALVMNYIFSRWMVFKNSKINKK